jgi:hypothetical protein
MIRQQLELMRVGLLQSFLGNFRLTMMQLGGPTNRILSVAAQLQIKGARYSDLFPNGLNLLFPACQIQYKQQCVARE